MVSEQQLEIQTSNGVIDTDFERDVIKGHGSYDLNRTTGPKTFVGWIRIDAPEGGTWSVVAYDDGKEIFRAKGVERGQKVPFKHTVRVYIKLHVDFDWSVKEDTKLKGHLHVEY